MLRPYDLLESVLIDIEEGIREGVNIISLADKHGLTERHLRRLFKFAFKQSLAGYIRSRKLTASLDDLLKTDSNIVDIAILYGYDYEQSYLAAFKREFGVTPGNLRKGGGYIVKVKPPLQLFNENKLYEHNLFFGPDIVMVPEFHVIGKVNRMAFDYQISAPNEAAKGFWFGERELIKNIINPSVYIGMVRVDTKNKCFDYIPSVQVRNAEYIPQGLEKCTFDTSLCARFRYIGKHHYYDLDTDIMSEMYKVIDKYYNDENAKYALLSHKVFFERLDIDAYDGTYCQMEWFTPVVEKSKLSLLDQFPAKYFHGKNISLTERE